MTSSILVFLRQRRLEEHRVGRLLISVFVAALVMVTVVSNLPVRYAAQLLRILVFFLVLMPAGESLSVDRWRVARDRFWEFPARAPWALRLVQIQVSLLYLSAFYHKIDGGGWTNGQALSYTWRMDDIARFHAPAFLQHSLTLSTMLSFLTLATELLIGLMVWVPSARRLVLALGVALHLGIDLTLRIGFFSTAIMVAYVAFLSPQTASRLILAARHYTRRSSPPTVEDSTAEPGEIVSPDDRDGVLIDGGRVTV